MTDIDRTHPHFIAGYHAGITEARTAIGLSLFDWFRAFALKENSAYLDFDDQEIFAFVVWVREGRMPYLQFRTKGKRISAREAEFEIECLEAFFRRNGKDIPAPSTQPRYIKEMIARENGITSVPEISTNAG